MFLAIAAFIGDGVVFVPVCVDGKYCGVSADIDGIDIGFFDGAVVVFFAIIALVFVRTNIGASLIADRLFGGWLIA